MADDRSDAETDNPLSPLHELISRLLTSEKSPPKSAIGGLKGLGTMQPLNDRLASQPVWDFINYNLRGIGQVIFVNNPVSGLLISIALWIQSPWVAVMGLIGVVASTLTAIWLKLDRDSIRNGIFGFNGLLVGAALATFGLPGNGAWNPVWAIAAILFSALTTVLLKTAGVWFASKLKFPSLTLTFNIATLLFLGAVLILRPPFFDLGVSALSPTPSASLNGFLLAKSLPIGFGQVFLADRLVAGILVLLAVAICSPIAAVVGLLGCFLGVTTGAIAGVAPEKLYAGLWGYNSALTAIALGGVFYAPNSRSIIVGAVGAIAAAIVSGLLGAVFAPLGLSVLTVPFCIVTIGGFLILRRSLPSVVPVALHAVTSPEEHWGRYLVAKDIITNFRRQLEAAMLGKRRSFLFEKASASLEGDLRYIFDAIDTDRSRTLSTSELAEHLRKSGQVWSGEELTYLFKGMDFDDSGAIDFEEFAELMLRYRRLMARYAEFVTYFLPIDTNEDDIIGIEEMNVALCSVQENPLSSDEVAFLQKKTGGQPLTWNRFVEVLLLT